MQRRDLLKMIVAATGTSIVGSYAFAYDQLPSESLANTKFTPKEAAFMNEVGELIIPKTTTPGAKDANVGVMMSIIVSDCYTNQQQSTFKQGLKAIDDLSKAQFGQSFIQCKKTDKQALIASLDKQAKEHIKNNQPSGQGEGSHYFTMIKQLVIFTFFTSKVGATEVLRHVAIPGSYDGELPYKKGDRAWSR